ncbi:MAG: valine--tRNA ligase, partial [Actinomycetota bacterium]|nr:valine--tRNA ligase [Actinomycetota bacterium]
EGSIHRSPWPRSDAIRPAAAKRDGLLTHAGLVLSLIRKAKTDAQTSMRTPLAALTVHAPADTLEAIALVEDDLRNAGVITGSLTFEPAPDLSVEAVFG